MTVLSDTQWRSDPGMLCDAHIRRWYRDPRYSVNIKGRLAINLRWKTGPKWNSNTFQSRSVSVYSVTAIHSIGVLFRSVSFVRMTNFSAVSLGAWRPWRWGAPVHWTSVTSLLTSLPTVANLWRWITVSSSINATRDNPVLGGRSVLLVMRSRLLMLVADKAVVIENSFCGFLLTILSYVIIVFTMPFSLCLCLKVTDSLYWWWWWWVTTDGATRHASLMAWWLTVNICPHFAKAHQIRISHEPFCLITGRQDALSAYTPVFRLLGTILGYFCPTRATCCADRGKIWRG